MAQISKNGFDLIGTALHQMKGKGLRGFIGTLVFILPLALMCCIPYAGWAIALFCWGVFETGYIRYMRALMNDENPNLLLIFSEVRTGWFELYLGALLVILFVIGSALIFIPGVVLIGYYSLSLFTAEYFHIEKVGDAMYQTAIRMDGNKTTMFSYKAIFYAVYALLLCSAVGCGYGVYLLWAINPVLSVLVAILAFLVLVLVWSFVTTYFHATNEVFFQEVLANYELKQAKYAKKKAEKEAKAEVKEEGEEPKAEKPAKKAPVKKTPAKKAPAKKAAPKAKK